MKTNLVLVVDYVVVRLRLRLKHVSAPEKVALAVQPYLQNTPLAVENNSLKGTAPPVRHTICSRRSHLNGRSASYQRNNT